MVCGVWCVVCGVWFVVCGVWFVVCSNAGANITSEPNQNDQSAIALGWGRGLVHSQLNGLLSGYNAFAPLNQQLTFDQLYLMNMFGDLETLGEMFPPLKPAQGCVLLFSPDSLS